MNCIHIYIHTYVNLQWNCLINIQRKPEIIPKLIYRRRSTSNSNRREHYLNSIKTMFVILSRSQTNQLFFTIIITLLKYPCAHSLICILHLIPTIPTGSRSIVIYVNASTQPFDSHYPV